ncbi:hypothetical protein HA520_06515 [Azotobacter chroococcum]|uniref:Uncharacterized protein n=1 Tax=Azotobacter chroococcum TaxID=353 RepID=A0AA44C7N4_9GAMM|nr:hypothetical protein [Azotobacter chroococcum]NHN76942.1 hypothetical protein [Azotobacter chroococcum]
MLSSNHLPGPVVPFALRRLAVALPCAPGRDATPVEAGKEGRGALQLKPAGPDTGYTARRTLSATRTDTPLNEIPRPVSITTGQQMRERKVVGAGDAPSYTAGEEPHRGPHEVASLARGAGPLPVPRRAASPAHRLRAGRRPGGAGARGLLRPLPAGVSSS